jgi:drug/metabolite transporter (DMT)-like permease
MVFGRGTVLLIMLVAVVALALGETALSKGMKQIGRLEAGWLAEGRALLHDGWIAAGLILLLAHLGLYMLALRSADLSFALPLTAASYPLAAVLARFYLHENISAARAIGTLLITLGVAIVVLGEPGGALSRQPAQAQPAVLSPERPGSLET